LTQLSGRVTLFNLNLVIACERRDRAIIVLLVSVLPLFAAGNQSATTENAPQGGNIRAEVNSDAVSQGDIRQATGAICAQGIPGVR
jgi:hypothetical protein